ncbi:PSD1 and planctomycete cytochrome C domain-containing protein [Planctomicrobium sp. SH661]|uniref:PSD1 and planctomycete cytochrome C domain-containing protein n=1 Tax=Planctomicrobium sp. SH661 TaxID=3448124 RepID=UPI003F5B594F
MSTSPSYLRDIRPIFSETCFTCHGPDAAQRQAELRLDQRESATRELPSGNRAIAPGLATLSELIRRIESTDPDTVMPPPDSKHQLSTEEKQTLRAWIQAGAHYQEHWAFVKPQLPQIPHTKNKIWGRNAIDQFVLARLEAEGLAPSLEADRITLIRRLSLDLTGLPPTVAEVDAFLADDSPEAYEALVDRLLASPHYGEKMAQIWLDLARFGDSTGYADDHERPNFPYRDYVINAFNANMPFDQFTVENIAGDLLPNATQSQQIASGFHRLHRVNQEGGSDPEEFRIVYAVDRANTTAATWMGLTFGCAQCHDHKYDPISQREYYALSAFFNSLDGEIPINGGPEFQPSIRVPSMKQQAQLELLDQQISRLEFGERELLPGVEEEYERWLVSASGELSPVDNHTRSGVAGGVVARSGTSAYYGDVKLNGKLTHRDQLHNSGQVVVTSGVNSAATIGHFSTTPTVGRFAAFGFDIEDGPRFFPAAITPDGSVLHGDPIGGAYGLKYAWSWDYDPSRREIRLTMTYEGRTVGSSHLLLRAGEEFSGQQFDAFGITTRDLSQEDAPIRFFLDELTYTVSAGQETRQQSFDRDPGWHGLKNTSDGYHFGYQPRHSLENAEKDQVFSLLSVAAQSRTPEQTQQLRSYYIKEHAPQLFGLQKELAAKRQEKILFEKGIPQALVWREMETPRPAHVLKRGDYLQPGEQVERGIPSIFPPLDADVPQDRLALARWLVSSEHPLTARVAVNRLWTQLFGRGLVRTPEDFGVRGELPTHPDLLDWLAVTFMTPAPSADADTAAWDVKRMLKLIVMSSTYRQSSAFSPQLLEHDSDNRLLARNSRFRLTAEEIRDSALMSAGVLSPEIGGRSVFPFQPEDFYRDKEDGLNEMQWRTDHGAQKYRRGLYTFIRRTCPYPAFQTFDAPSRGECTVIRSTTNTPLQALITLNDPVFVELARAMASSVASTRQSSIEKLTFLFRSVLSRFPSADEERLLLELYHKQLTVPASGNQTSEQQAWMLIANVLLNLDEAITRP